jgi:divalent metal cation (Fe/Co/Zn/Cd) transporter
MVVLTLAWNVIEGAIAITSGLGAGSIALIGFGFDSYIEVFASIVLLWRFRSASENAERRAILLIGISFFVLAAYIVANSAYALLFRLAPEESVTGIALAILSIIIMPALAFGKRAIGKRLGSRSLQAESTETLVCTWLSLSLLAGLALNALFGWWWADPVAALVMVYFVAKEGWQAVFNRELCCEAPGLNACECPACASQT